MHKTTIKEDKGFMRFLKEQAVRDSFSTDVGSDFLKKDNSKEKKNIRSYNEMKEYLENKNVSKEVIKSLDASLKEYELFIKGENKLTLADIKLIYKKINSLKKGIQTIHQLINEKNIITEKFDLDDLKQINNTKQQIDFLQVTIQDLAIRKVKGFSSEKHFKLLKD